MAMGKMGMMGKKPAVSLSKLLGKSGGKPPGMSGDAEDSTDDMGDTAEEGDELPPGFATAVQDFKDATDPEEAAQALYHAIQLCS